VELIARVHKQAEVSPRSAPHIATKMFSLMTNPGRYMHAGTERRLLLRKRNPDDC
jgi:hypothetical protein